MAIFVTFEDKLGHTPAAASVLKGADAPLACEIKVLEKIDEREFLASKMQLC